MKTENYLILVIIILFAVIFFLAFRESQLVNKYNAFVERYNKECIWGGKDGEADIFEYNLDWVTNSSSLWENETIRENDK